MATSNGDAAEAPGGLQLNARSGGGRNGQPAWAHVIRGGETDVAAPVSVPEAAADRSDGVDNNGGGAGAVASPVKKSVWNKPSDGVAEVGSVMSAVSWPPLSEAAARPSPKSASSDASFAGVSQLEGPVPATSSPKPASSNHSNSNSTPTHAFPVRQKSMKRGDRGASNGGIVPPPPPVENPQSNLDKQGSLGIEPSPREVGPHRGSNLGNDQPRGSYRRGNNGTHSRGGGGHYNNNYGNQRDPDRGSYEWNNPRNFSGRDVHMQQQPRPVPRTFIRPPPNSVPFITPPRPFVNPLDIPSPVYYVHTPPPEAIGGVPFVAHPGPPPIFFPVVVDPGVRVGLMKQIEYYFSAENLCKDIFLRRNMDEQGWVPITLIAGFNRVRQVTNNIQIILDAVQTSTILEVQGDKVRSRNDWMNWPLPPNIVPAVTGPASPASSSYDTLTSRFNMVTLDGRGVGNESMQGDSVHIYPGGAPNRTFSGESSPSATGSSNSDGASQVAAQGRDDFVNTRSSKDDSC